MQISTRQALSLMILIALGLLAIARPSYQFLLINQLVLLGLFVVSLTLAVCGAPFFWRGLAVSSGAALLFLRPDLSISTMFLRAMLWTDDESLSTSTEMMFLSGLHVAAIIVCFVVAWIAQWYERKRSKSRTSAHAESHES